LKKRAKNYEKKANAMHVFFFVRFPKRKKGKLQKKKRANPLCRKNTRKKELQPKAFQKKSFQLLRKRAAFLRVLFASEKKKNMQHSLVICKTNFSV
jgi:hypothetical protein